MEELRVLRNDLRVVLLGVIDYINGMCLDNFEDGWSYEAGETVESKEMQKMEQVWNKDWDCPICGIVNKSEVHVGEVGDDSVSNKVKDMDGHLVSDRDIADRKIKISFDSKEGFDEHMRVAHGIVVIDEGDIEDMFDLGVMKEYGSHYTDFKYGHVVKTGDKRTEKQGVRVKNLDVTDAGNTVYFESNTEVVEEREK